MLEADKKLKAVANFTASAGHNGQAVEALGPLRLEEVQMLNPARRQPGRCGQPRSAEALGVEAKPERRSIALAPR